MFPPIWLKNDKDLPINIRIIDNSIYIYNVDEDDNGNYTCTGSYNRGNSEFTATSVLYVGCMLETTIIVMYECTNVYNLTQS